MSKIINIFKLNENSLYDFLYRFLCKYYKEDKIYYGYEYLMVEGDSPICLIAHLDTVFEDSERDRIEIFYDQKQKVYWSPDGLGADDRAGVLAIIKIVKEGYRPSIIFTTKEEVGGLGALKLIEDFAKPPMDIRCLIELDRCGYKDCVFYNCDNEEFTKYIESFDFKTSYGTFSDISHIAPIWGIAAVNLSVGYYNEHSYREFLDMNILNRTIAKVKDIISDIETHDKFIYIEKEYFPMPSNIGLCKLCGKSLSKNVLFNICSDCYKQFYLD